MKTEILSSAIEHIDDRFITEAANYRPHPAVRSAATFRRLIALTAAAVLCLCAALPALAAADVDGAYMLLYAISPALAQQMKPINLSCEDNGIRMDVLSADVSDDFPIASGIGGDTAHICVALTDLTGERIDATTDLFDSYFIRSPFDSAATCRMIDYNAQTRTATFLLSITHMQGEPIDGKKLTFAFTRFISGKESFSGTMPEIDLSAAPLHPATQTEVSLRGGTPNADVSAFLQPDETLFHSPMEGVTITAVGFIEGKLHVQAHCADILTLDTNGYLKLYTAENKPIQPIEQISFWDDARSGSYEEFIFDIPPEQAAQCRIFGYFTRAENCTEGNWEITFKL